MHKSTLHKLKVIDSHTGGEPTRIVIEGGPDLGTGPLASRLKRFQREFDKFRSAVVNEPRGSDVVVGAMLVEPEDASCVTGVIFFNNVGYLGMCGHGTIGLMVTLAHMGKIAPGEHRIDTPVGVVTAALHPNGEVSVTNVPSWRAKKSVTVDVPGIGPVTGDVAWSGNWFFLVETHGQKLVLTNVDALTDYCWQVRQAVNAQGFPEVDHVELFGPAIAPGANSRNFVQCPGKAYDRSPCGTGTSSKLACLAADGKLAEGATWIQESIIGSSFSGKFHWLDRAAGKVSPTITGTAFVNAESTQLLDEKGPFLLGHPPVSESYDIIIVGAGIVGAACAAECARNGLKTLVLDRGPIAGGTTAAGMGHIVVMDDSEAQFALTYFSRQLWQELIPVLPPDVEYEACGTLWVAADDEEMAEVHRKEKFYTDRGVRVEVLDAAGVANAEPNLRKGLAGGLRVVDDAVVYPPCAARFLFEQARQHGAELRTGVAVRELLADGGVLLNDGSRISAGRAVSATGPWSPVLTPGLPVRKRKGHLVITDRHPRFVRHQIVELGYLKSAHSTGADSVAFNIQPRKTGQMLIGSSRQFDAVDSAVDQTILDRMLKRAIEYLPTLGGLSSIRVWTGHRAATPDKLPLIGPSIVSDRIWLATGHEGLGITTSLGTGRLLADLLLGRPTAIPAAPFAPARFADAVTRHE